MYLLNNIIGYISSISKSIDEWMFPILGCQVEHFAFSQVNECYSVVPISSSSNVMDLTGLHSVRNKEWSLIWEIVLYE